MKLLATLTALFLLSYSTFAQKSDTPRQMQEGVYLKDGGIIDSSYTRGIVMNIERTMFGLKHSFVVDSGDTLHAYYRMRLVKGSCYKVPTVDLKKSSK